MFTPTLEDLRSVQHRVARDYAFAAREVLSSAPALEGEPSDICRQGAVEANEEHHDDVAEAIEYLEAATDLTDWVLEDLVAVARSYRLDPERLLKETVAIFAEVVAMLDSASDGGPAVSATSHAEGRPKHC